MTIPAPDDARVDPIAGSMARRAARAAAGIGTALAVAWAIGVPGAAEVRADVGARVAPGDLTVTEPLRAGATYHLPDLIVSDPADEAGDYSMLAGSIVGQVELPISPDWIRFSRTSFSLGPGEQRTVSVDLVVPPDAGPGDYAGLLKAQVTPVGTSGVAVGVAAATKVRFRVARSDGVEGFVASVRDAVGGLGPWPLVVLLLLALLLLGRGVWRRWDVRIERRR